MEIYFKNYTILMTALAIAALVLGASQLSLFRIANDIGHDFIMRNSPWQQVSEKIIIVEVDENHALQGDETWIKLLTNLIKLNPEKIVFDFSPEHVSEEFYKLAESSKKVILGRKIYINNRQSQNDDSANDGISSERHTPHNYLLQPLPDAGKGTGVDIGLAPLPESQYGVFRSQRLFIDIADTISPTFYYLAAKEIVGDIRSVPESEFRINFMGGPNRLPELSVQRILSGNMVSEIISGRTILIGIADPIRASGFFTPISTKFGDISNVAFEGFALDTLISDRIVTSIPSWMTALMTATGTIGGLFLFQWLSFQNALRAVIIATIIYLAACWFFLVYLFVLLPICEFIFTIWLAYGFAWRHQLSRENQIIENLQKKLNLKLIHKNLQTSFYEIEDHWSQITSMIYQTLHLNRVIFLDRAAGEHRLKEIKALHCSIDDILEKRRDYKRYPYTLAIGENRPVFLERPYLKETNIREREYLAPLMFAGEILGFWAFTIDPRQVSDDAQFKALTQNYMEQISEILFYRKEWQKRKAAESHWLFRYLRFEGGITSLHALEATVEVWEKQTFDLQGVFNNMSTRSILYDLFGRVLLVNKNMEELTQAQGIKPYQMTLLDFMVEITRLNIFQLKQLVQTTIVELKTQTINFSGFGGQDNYQLCLHPLQLDTHEILDTADETRVFQIRGVLLELLDLAEVKTRYSFKESIFEQFNEQLREKLDRLASGLTQLSDPAATAKSGLIDGMKSDVRYLLAKIDNIESYSKLIAESAVDYYPQNLDSAVDKLLANCRNAITEKKILIRRESQSASAMVLAQPGGLDAVLEGALQAMIEDTFEAGEIRLEIEATGVEVSIRISNQGVGMLQDNLQQFWSSENPASDDDIAKLAQAIKTVQEWKGHIELSCTIGEGSRIDIFLQQFI